MSFQTKNGATFANDASTGTKAWTNPSNAQLPDSSYATAALIEEDSNYLKATNFSFTLPSLAYVDGVALRVERARSVTGDGFVVDHSVLLVVSGTIQGNEKADTLTQWGSSDLYVRYPISSTTDQWGLSLTPALVNASNFGAVFSCSNIGASSSGRTARVDHIELTVYYVDPTAKVHRSMKRNIDLTRRFR